MYEKIHLAKPLKIDKRRAVELFVSHLANANHDKIEQLFNRVSNDEYLYWDKAKYYFSNSSLQPDELWYIVRQIRRISSIETPIVAENGKKFTWYRPLYTDKYLREIDMYTGGAFLTEKTTAAQENERQKYLTRGIVEESIASSQLEGADTASKYAKKMITENIRPRTKGEQMIMNNYRVMKKIEQEYKDRELSLYMLQTLQSELTDGTLDTEFAPGELRKDSDNIVVVYDEKIAHVPPKANFVKKELERLIEYANDDSDFVHPAIKAIQLHFWIGYLHPFPDGNGRIARAVFYWYLFRHNYWAIGYVPISMMLKRSQKGYAFAYIYAEQDDYDFTYFFDYNIRCILKAIGSFNAHIEKKIAENEKLGVAIHKKMPELNQRQIYALKYLLSSPDATSSKNSYSIMHNVTSKTAYRDLKALQSLGLVSASVDGRLVIYRATEKAKELFK